VQLSETSAIVISKTLSVRQNNCHQKDVVKRCR